MKQAKISNFFSKTNGEAVKRKLEEDQPPPPTSFQRAKMESAPKKRKQSAAPKGKRKKDKENGVRKIANVFAVSTQAPKAVLSPTKLNENVRVGGSPAKDARDSDVEMLVEDASFDDVLLESEEDFWYLIKSELVLDKPLRCEVLRFMLTNHPKCEQVVLLRAEGSEKKGIVRLRDMWTFLSLNVNDTVTVKAQEEACQWVVNAKNGYVVLHPDVMMPITSLVNGIYCLRRGVLTNAYKNINQNSKQMLFGRLIHHWVQEVLKKKLDTEEEISEVLQTILTSKSYLKEFYLNGLKLEELSLESSVFVPKLASFISTYLKGDSSAITGGFKGLITKVLDIEEIVSSSKIGIHGRVDVTVEVQTEDRRKRVVPLELKTGRASMSAEHKIQVIVYTLLLDEIVRNVESGLLLYLKDGVMEEVSPDFSEVRNLLMLRNEFVKYVKDEEVLALPEPIRSTSCSKCPVSRICVTYLRNNGLSTLPVNHPMRTIDFSDLKQTHMEYFISWTRMLYHEYKLAKEIVISGLTLEGEVKQDVDGFSHLFRMEKKEKLESGIFVEIRTRDRLVGRGKVLDITDTHCTVRLPKKLENFQESYQIIQAKSNLLSMTLTNLAYFLEEEYKKLRNLIIDREAPEIHNKITKKAVNEDCVKLLKSLNVEQQRAIFKTVACKDYLLIKGPPGTGKTETIVALIKFLYLQNQTVLISGHTHSSIDNILSKLKGIDFVRFGSLSSISEKLHHRSFSRLLENCQTMEDIKRLYECKVMASTCWGLDLDMLRKIKFDYCLIDESSQVMQMEAVRPLLFCRKFVLIGDSNQLPPVVKSPEAKSLGMDVSIFERLENEGCTVSLSKQYRMNEVLNNLANELTYSGCLECGNDVVAKATLKIQKLAGNKEWIREVLSEDMAMSAVFVDTSTYFDEESFVKPSHTNTVEAGLIVRLVKALIEGGVNEEDIGVISPFCDQVQILIRQLKSVNISNVEVSTVDQFQGRDKDVIFFSCTKICRGNVNLIDSTHILNDKRRLTVAVTRAKNKLVILGDIKSVSGYNPMKRLLACLSRNQVIRLENGEKDFSWDDVH